MFVSRNLGSWKCLFLSVQWRMSLQWATWNWHNGHLKLGQAEGCWRRFVKWSQIHLVPGLKTHEEWEYQRCLFFADEWSGVIWDGEGFMSLKHAGILMALLPWPWSDSCITYFYQSGSWGDFYWLQKAELMQVEREMPRWAREHI